jgi:archaellum component FlaC
MPKAWEEMSFSEKLNTFRSEADSLRRVIDSAARRIGEIENELKTMESGVEADSLKRVIDSAARRIEGIENELKAMESVASARKENLG